MRNLVFIWAGLFLNIILVLQKQLPSVTTGLGGYYISELSGLSLRPPEGEQKCGEIHIWGVAFSFSNASEKIWENFVTKFVALRL